MTVAGPIPLKYEKERAELEAVLASAPFLRAPKLARLLSYLCERLFAGQAGQIKEYSIAVEVFERPAAFDQDSDSIVRVEANRLRKRLAEYYAREGLGSALRITIPVGQYVPEFVCVGSRAEGEVPASSSPEAASPPSGRRFTISRRGVVLIASAIVVVVATVIGWYLLRPVSRPAGVAVPSKASPPPEMAFGLPAGEEVRILCGATHTMVDHAGKLWSADTAYLGGSAVASETRHVARTQDAAFYRTSRQGTFQYDIPLKTGVYELRLHFAELTYGPESSGGGGEGSRLMTVRANGKALLSQFDVAADAGASDAADVKVFPDVRPAADGRLHLDFVSDRGAPAMVSAIEILPGVRGRIRPVRILARHGPYYSNDSQWWSPDTDFEGGQMATYTHAVKGTDDSEMFDSERWGNFSYAIPVAPGRYALTLFFTVRPGDWPPGPMSAATPTPHIFNVFCNGKALLANLNLAGEARDSDVVVRRFTGLSPNAQGKLLLNFVPVQGYATVTGIEVLPQ
ncbi:hypothetical protein DYQ86_13440 [Acidobacteria bacterium AB60]|nr:hypothetical protein DYQ86_13440 [Acidobacteria bacterium AB60]